MVASLYLWDDLQHLEGVISLRDAIWSTSDQEINKAQFVVSRCEGQDGYPQADKTLNILAEEGESALQSFWQFLLKFRIGDSTGRYYLERPVHKSVASAADFDQVATWLSRCIWNRDSCIISKSNMTTFQFLNFYWANETLAPKLQLVNCPRPVNYAALSYCWSSDQSTKTTCLTLETQIDDILLQT